MPLRDGGMPLRDWMDAVEMLFKAMARWGLIRRANYYDYLGCQEPGARRQR
jgi:hypothetical protein